MSKEKLIQSIRLKLSLFMDPQTVERVTDIIVKDLQGYDVSEIGTEIIPYDDENERLLKTYCACLSLDGKSRKTIEQYAFACKSMADTIGKNYREMTAYDIRLWFALKKDGGASNRTLENYRSYISTFFRWMTAEGYIQTDPSAKIKPIQYADEIRNAFSSVEVDKLRSHCKKPIERSIVEFLLSSGVRVSELCNLDVSDIDFNTRTVNIRHGKGDKARCTYIDDVTLMHLRQYLSNRKQISSALFVPNRGDRYTPGGIRYMLNAIGKRAGVEDVHPHRFRRTLATNLATRGMAVQDIQKILGHSNIQTTMLYVAVSDKHTHLSYQQYTA